MLTPEDTSYLKSTDPAFASFPSQAPINHTRPWTPEDDQLILEWVQKHGKTNITDLGVILQRKNSQIWERYHQFLNPNNSKLPFSTEEEIKLMQAFRLNNRKFSKTAVMFHDRSRFSCKYHFYKIIRRELPELKRHDKYKDLLVKEAMVWDCGSVKKLRKWPIDVMQNICDVIAQRLDDPHYVPPKPLVEEKAKSPVKLTATSPKKIVKTDSPKKETPVTLKSEIIKILSNENVEIAEASLTSDDDLILRVNLGISSLKNCFNFE